jgi:hypothetical protein
MALMPPLNLTFAELYNRPSPPSDGSTASYYELPADAKELQDLISHRDMNSQMGEIFRAVYRYGQCPHSPKLRDAKKIKFYIEAEIARLEKLKE